MFRHDAGRAGSMKRIEHAAAFDRAQRVPARRPPADGDALAHALEDARLDGARVLRSSSSVVLRRRAVVLALLVGAGGLLLGDDRITKIHDPPERRAAHRAAAVLGTAGQDARLD